MADRLSVKAQKIALNTALLYFRMLFVMGVSLFTSRVNIQALGFEDYGLFNIVAGIIGLVAFLNSALGTSSARFITVSLGENDISMSRLLFDTIYKVHVILGLFIVIIAEILGIYLIYNVLNIPHTRIYACNIIFQCSVLIMFINLVNIPMTASIIAHEKFNVFAYIGIYEVIAKLLSSYLLFIWPYDKLILWGILNLVISISLWLYYFFYCKKNFEEFSITKKIDILKAKQVTAFSFWNVLGSLSIALKNAGVNIVLNIFFGPLINAANAIAYQVNNAITNFSMNFTTAINPQIYKTYAQGKYAETETLVHWGGKLSFFLVVILGLPLVVEMDSVLTIWLKEYPPYAPIFCRLIIYLAWIESFNYSIGTAIQANGRIKYYQLWVSGLSLFNLPLAYLALKLGATPDIALKVSIVISIMTLVIRIYFIKSLLGFNCAYYFKDVLFPSMLMLAVAIPACLWIKYLFDSLFMRFIGIIIVSTLCNSIVFYAFLGKDYRRKITSWVWNKIGIE